MGAIANGLAYHGGIAHLHRHLLQPSPTTSARPCGWRRCRTCRWSSSSPTTPSAWARTAPPTSRSSTWPRCGPCPHVGGPPRRRQRGGEAWKLAMNRKDGPTFSLSRTNVPTLAGTQIRPGVGRAEGRLRAVGCARRPARGHPDRHRFGVVRWPWLPRTSWPQAASRARVVSLPCWEAFAPRTRPTGTRCCPVDHRARVGRGRQHLRLDEVGGRTRGERRTGTLRGERAGRPDLQGARLHAGQRGRPGESCWASRSGAG
jgi:hypothetical protein